MEHFLGGRSVGGGKSLSGGIRYKQGQGETWKTPWPCCTSKCDFTAVSGGVDILDVPDCHLLRQRSSK